MTWLDRFLARERVLRALAHVPANSRVLDIGCHDGLFFRTAAARGIKGIGLDPELDSDITLPNARLYANAFPSPQVNETFDAAIALAVLEHIPPNAQNSFAAACYAALKPAGRMVLTVPSPRVDDILAILTRLRLVDGMSLEQHYGFDTANTPALFETAGFRLLHHQRFQLGLNNLFVFERPAS